MQARKINGIGYLTGNWPLDRHKSTIVFIHGVGGSGLFWQFQIDSLTPQVNTLAIDLPGHGQSDGEGMDAIEDYAYSVIDLITTINVPNPIPCGISMGGAITLQILINHPDSIKAGILINTGAKLKVAPVIFDTLANSFSEYLEMMGQLVAAENTDKKKIKLFKEDTAKCKPEVILRDFQACHNFDVMQQLESIPLPVLVVSAEDDQMTPPKYGDYLVNAMPYASGVHIPDAGHILPWEKPENFNAAIAEFINDNDL